MFDKYKDALLLFYLHHVICADVQQIQGHSAGWWRFVKICVSCENILVLLFCFVCLFVLLVFFFFLLLLIHLLNCFIFVLSVPVCLHVCLSVSLTYTHVHTHEHPPPITHTHPPTHPHTHIYIHIHTQRNIHTQCLVLCWYLYVPSGLIGYVQKEHNCLRYKCHTQMKDIILLFSTSDLYGHYCDRIQWIVKVDSAQ